MLTIMVASKHCFLHQMIARLSRTHIDRRARFGARIKLDHFVGEQGCDERDADQAAKEMTSASRSMRMLNCARSDQRIDKYEVIALAGNVTATSAAYSSTCDMPCLAVANFTRPMRVVQTPIMVPDTGRMCDDRLSLRVLTAIRLDMTLTWIE